MTEKETIAQGSAASEDLELVRRLKPLIRECIDIHHDLNNPLAGILGYAEFILSGPEQLTDTVKKDLQQIVKCAEKMKEITDRIARSKARILEDMHPDILREFLKEEQ